MDLVNETRHKDKHTFYSIQADDYLINNRRCSELAAGTDTPATRGFPAVIDSGFSVSVLPPSLVTLFYDAFVEPPQPIEMNGSPIFATPCNNTGVPTFAVQIEGQVLEMSRESTMLARLRVEVDGVAMCGLSVQPGIELAAALGSPFMSNLVSVFDVGGSKMWFAQRDFENGAEARKVDDATRAKDEL